MLTIGILGVGHLGKIHIKCIREIANYTLVGFYDSDETTAIAVEKEFCLKRFSSASELIDAVDVVDIVTPTLSHYECASEALRKSKHVFIEKPLVNTLEKAKELIDLVHSTHVKVQVGHVERFNPAYIASLPYIKQPMFVETHRLSQFNPRGTDVSVVLDLMIHDIDIILSVVRSEVTKICANGVSIVTDTPDIANARIEFANGCVANLTASRISMKNMRKIRFFQDDTYISIDFFDKKTEIIHIKNVDKDDNNPFAMIIDLGKDKGQKQIIFEKPDVKPINSIQSELESFYHSIINNTDPVVTIHDGYKALEVAYKIIEEIKNPLNKR